MMSANDMMRSIFDKCEIILENEVISKELLLRTYSEFLLQTVNKEKHNVGIVLHTGSICFDVVTIVHALVSCLVYNKTNGDDLINNLEVGNKVIYGHRHKKIFEFIGKEIIGGIEYVVLKDKDGGSNKIPCNRWNMIIPYCGKGTSLGGRGLRNKNGLKEEFFKDVLGEAMVPSVIDKSVVIVMAHEIANFLIQNISIGFNNKRIGLLELITASYFTEHNEYPYSGNIGKNEANIKFTSKVSVARDLAWCKDGNKHIGVIICGNEFVKRNQTELPEVLHRRSLQFVYVTMSLAYVDSTSLIDEYSDASVFACTKDFLLSFSLVSKSNKKYCAELNRQVDAMIENKTASEVIPSTITWNEYKRIRLALRAIKNTDYIVEQKDVFLIQAYSLLNLILTAVFNLSDLEHCVESGKVNIVSPKQRIDEIKKISKKFPDTIRKLAEDVIDFIEICYLELEETSGKAECLKKAISENRNKKIAIVVPKAYYETVLSDIGIYQVMRDRNNLTIVTANRFDTKIIYDHIFVAGLFEGSKFDVFKCKSSKNITTLLYSFEERIYKSKLSYASKLEQNLNSHIFGSDVIGEMTFDNNDNTDVENEAFIELKEFEQEFDDYFKKLNEIVTMNSIKALSNVNSNALCEIVAIADFDTGEKALFTKHYKAYVFDAIKGTVKETEVLDLNEGDSLVFAQRNTERRDIVDDILSKLMMGNKLNSDVVECYKKSRQWKERLIKYMQNHNLTAKIVAKKMKANGVQVQENTVIGWLDEDSHTIGPRKVDSIQQIALLVDDEEMLNNADVYYDACNKIRRLRRDILKQIGDAIISSLRGQKINDNTLLADVYERIDSIILILKIESITAIKREVPINIINRPISM